ncbi:hypothetical protein [Jatrophihabitans lederbergiae]|uniref:MarR family transcriptional regulator n=1 Tax=Jatrophihabitans lederbergiae TaxID=3075547 RepID=A0ABU2JHR6_9ACTN|nr:hypothetical protein [Jatrophihabitans sp. DSM 44399]MDT0264527.1 hypothetical protein [Jatrophihabitans sp. DSM 44399]
MNNARKSAGARVTRVRPAGDIVAETLAGHPDRTAAELTQLAGLGGSTVAKALATLEKAGRARRHAPDLGGSHTDGRGSADAGSGSGGRRPEGVPARTTTKAATGGRRDRLGKGELTTLVLEYLVAHSDVDLGPTAISRALQRSQGAVANCLTKLTASGDLVQTCEQPRRYRVTS